MPSKGKTEFRQSEFRRLNFDNVEILVEFGHNVEILLEYGHIVEILVEFRQIVESPILSEFRRNFDNKTFCWILYCRYSYGISTTIFFAGYLIVEIPTDFRQYT